MVTRAVPAMQRSATSAMPENHAGRGASRNTMRWRAAGAILLVLFGGVLLVGTTMRGIAILPGSPSATVEAPALAAGVPVLPAEPVDGTLTLVIPRGAGAAQQAGGPGYLMPSVISLTAGETIVLRNDDDVPHMILYAFLAPGETQTRTFTTPGSEVYSSGCGLHAAAFLNFTTIFVSEPA